MPIVENCLGDKNMKKVLSIAILIIMVALLMGCSTTNKDGSPNWTTNVPNSRTTFYAIGYGKLSNFQNSLMRAEAQAKDRIARWASTTVQGALTNYFLDSGTSGEQTIEMMESISSQIVNISLNGSRMEEQWTDPDGGVWVLYSYPIRNLKEAYRLKSEELQRKSEAYQVELLLDYLDIQLGD
jgi:hypothetical protein